MSSEAMAILELNFKTYSLRSGFHLIGNLNFGADLAFNIKINDQSVDAKHALLQITSSGMNIIDLNSKNGTFVNSTKIAPIELIGLPNSCSIKFGESIVFLTHSARERDSGYLDRATSPKNISDVIVSSQDHHESLNGYHRSKKQMNTSTPNSCKIMNNELQESQNCSDSNFNDSNIRSNSNKTSFVVPETQQLERSNSIVKKGIEKFSNISDDIDQNISILSSENSFLVPETQEICNLIADNQSEDTEFRISTQDFNSTQIKQVEIENEFLNEFEASNDSSNLCNGLITENIELSKTIETENCNKSSKQLNIDFDANDIEISNINRNAINKMDDKRENSLTPDLDCVLQMNNDNADKFDSIEYLDETSKTPDLIIDELNESDNGSRSVTPDLAISDILEKPINESNISFSNLITSMVRNDGDGATNTPYRSICKSNSNFVDFPPQIEDDDSDLEPTQVMFKRPVISNLPPSKDSNKENKPYLPSKNVVKPNYDGDNDLEPTQKFIAYKAPNNDADEMLEPTQKFFKNSLTGSQKKHFSFSLDSDSDDEMPIKPPKHLNTKKKNKCRNKLMSSGSEDDKPSQVKHRTTTSSSTSTTTSIGSKKISKSRSSHDTPTWQQKSPATADLDQLSDSQSFSFITCTPNFDFIKPYQTADIKKFGMCEQKPIKKTQFTLEETSDDDGDNDELLARLSKAQFENDQLDKLLCSKNGFLNTQKYNKKHIKENGKEIIQNVSKKYNDIVIPKSFKSIIEVKNSVVDINKIRSTESKSSKTLSESSGKSSEKSSLRKKHKDKLVESLSSNSSKSKSKDHIKVPSKEIGEKESPKQSSCRKRKHQKNGEETETETEIKKPNKMTEKEKPIKTKTSRKTKLEIADDGGKKKKQKQKIIEKATSSSTKVAQNKIITRSDTAKYKIAFTALQSEPYESFIEKMGAKIVNNLHDATILVTEFVARTSKFMVALALGTPIISKQWLDTMIAGNTLNVPYTNYPIKDPDGELKYNFCLSQTIKLSKKNKIFKDYKFFVTPKTNPKPEELHQIIGAGGGEFIEQLPAESLTKFYVVSSKGERKCWPSVRKNFPNVKIISVEGIFLSVMQHRLRLEDHMFSIDYV